MVEVAPCLTSPVFAAYLDNLCAVNPENNPNVSRYCDTDRGFRRGSLSQRPLSLPGTEPFLCTPVFVCAALCRQDCCTAAGAEIGIPPHNVCLCDEICRSDLHGYSHRCRLIRGCQRGRAGRAGPEVQVDLSETHTRIFTYIMSYQVIVCCNHIKDVWGRGIFWSNSATNF